MKKGVSGMAWIVLAYLMLCMPVRLNAFAAADGLRAYAGVCVEIGALCFRYDGVGAITPGKVAFSPRYPKGKKRAAKKGEAAMRLRKLRAMLDALGGAWQGSVLVRARIGGDAAQAALAAGAARAAICALTCLLPERAARDVRIEADPCGLQLLAFARCILVTRAGDIMFAAAKTAAINREWRRKLHAGAGKWRRRREEEQWISIPSRA